MCACHCAQVWYTIQNRRVLQIFSLILQTIIIAQMLPIRHKCIMIIIIHCKLAWKQKHYVVVFFYLLYTITAHETNNISAKMLKIQLQKVIKESTDEPLIHIINTSSACACQCFKIGRQR